MMKFLFGGAFAAGVLVILCIGRFFLVADNLGLLVTILIAAVYAIGAFELLQFRRATRSLTRALEGVRDPVEDLHQWLATVDPSLQNAARLRVEGERNGLPAPVLTPYLVGLLVMLGLLGTFVGMVDTLKGAVVALEGSSELEAIRAGLAAPIEGLGLAFGTSVAGVAASAMLGLLSTLSRRERLQASHLLDTKVGKEFREFSHGYQQQLAFQAINDQAQALPKVVDQLNVLARSLDEMGKGLSQRLLDNQVQFQNTVTTLYADLNESVNQSLTTGLNNSGKLISSSIQPIAETTLAQLNVIAKETQDRLVSTSEKQLSTLSKSSESSVEFLQQSVDTALAQQGESSAHLVQTIHAAMQKASSESQDTGRLLHEHFAATSEQWVEQQRDQAAKFSAVIRQELLALREEEGQRGTAAVERLSELQTSTATQLSKLGAALEEPMTRLMATAAKAPKAAAEVIEELRAEMNKNLERDNQLLEDRARLMEQLSNVSDSLSNSSTEQRKMVDSLMERSAETLNLISDKFGERLEGESIKLAGMVDHFASSSAEMASLGDSFNAAVVLFSESNAQLVENLTRIETSLEQSNSRSDEQLAYYVAQAREIIDHNLLSHQQIISALHAQKPTQLAVDEVKS